MSAQVALPAIVDLRLFAVRVLKGTAACYAPPWRLYCLESNTDRRPGDGLFHVLDRDYKPYRGYAVAFTREELDHAGLDNLAAFLSPIENEAGLILPILPEKYLRRAPRAYRLVLAAFINALADMLEQRGRR